MKNLMGKAAILLLGGTTGKDANLGDKLMLLEVIDRLKGQMPSARIVGQLRTGTYEERAKLGLYQFMERGRIDRLFGIWGYPALRRYRNSFGIVCRDDLTACVNFMGYRYFDKGGSETSNDADLLHGMRENGAANVILPQALGHSVRR